MLCRCYAGAHPIWFGIFLWLLAKNKLLTGDNLNKRKNVVLSLTCVLCFETKTCSHLVFWMFSCSRNLAHCYWDWLTFSILLICSVFIVGESVKMFIIRLWMLHMQLLCGLALWKNHNDICFNLAHWSGMHVIWRRIIASPFQWVVLCSGDANDHLVSVTWRLKQLAHDPSLLLWPHPGWFSPSGRCLRSPGPCACDMVSQLCIHGRILMTRNYGRWRWPRSIMRRIEAVALKIAHGKKLCVLSEEQ